MSIQDKAATSTGPQADQRSEILARSSFVLILLGFVASLIVVPFLLSSPMRSNVKTTLLIYYTAYLVGLVLVQWFLLRVDLARLASLLHPIVRLLARPGVSIALCIGLIEAFWLAYFVVNGVAPTLQPLLVLLAIWILIVLIVIAIALAPLLRRWLTRTLPLWSGTGLFLSIVLLLVVLYYSTFQVVNYSGMVSYLRGRADYRELVFFGNVTDSDMSHAYWEEMGGLKAIWSPYTYSRMDEHDGKYITITARGLRQTSFYVGDDELANEVFFFGGSTVWGDGVRDDYTIPSLVARLLDTEAVPARVANYGQIAYVSTQDLVLFELQLAQGYIPDVAVFYQGFNDIASTHIHDGAAGLPHNELNRAEEFHMGRVLDHDGIVLWRPSFSMSDVDFSLVTTNSDPVAATVERYLANVRVTRAVAEEYGVTAVFVWQPSIVFKESRTPEELVALEENEKIWPDYEEFYRQVDALLRQRVADEDINDIVILSDLFRDTEIYTFIDRVHLTEDGNFTVAEALIPAIAPLLDE